VTPRRLPSWEAITCTAAAVENPLTMVSDSRTLMLPRRNNPMSTYVTRSSKIWTVQILKIAYLPKSNSKANYNCHLDAGETGPVQFDECVCET